MNQRDFLTFIEDMIQSIEKVLRYLENTPTFADFEQNELIIDAVTRNYEIIGEASNQIPQNIKEKYPDLPWKQMYGLRNFAVHEYHIIDPKILWEIAKDHLQENKRQLEVILKIEG